MTGSRPDDAADEVVVRRYGLAAHILKHLAGSIVLFGMMFALFDATVLEWFAIAEAEGGHVAKGANWMRYAWVFGPALLLTMIGIRIMSRAIFESRGGVQ